MTAKITYVVMPTSKTAAIKVYSGGLRVGTIKSSTEGFYYLPKGLSDNPRNRGETFQSVTSVKRSLETE